jgi:hypothetical protein
MNQTAGLFETGVRKSAVCLHRFVLQQTMPAPKVRCQDDRERKQHQTVWAPPPNFRKSLYSSNSLNSFSRRAA